MATSPGIKAARPSGGGQSASVEASAPDASEASSEGRRTQPSTMRESSRRGRIDRIRRSAVCSLRTKQAERGVLDRGLDGGMIDDLYIALKQEVPSPYVVILAARIERLSQAPRRSQ